MTTRVELVSATHRQNNSTSPVEDERLTLWYKQARDLHLHSLILKHEQEIFKTNEKIHKISEAILKSQQKHEENLALLSERDVSELTELIASPSSNTCVLSAPCEGFYPELVKLVPSVEARLSSAALKTAVKTYFSTRPLVEEKSRLERVTEVCAQLITQKQAELSDSSCLSQSLKSHAKSVITDFILMHYDLEPTAITEVTAEGGVDSHEIALGVAKTLVSALSRESPVAIEGKVKEQLSWFAVPVRSSSEPEDVKLHFYTERERNDKTFAWDFIEVSTLGEDPSFSFSTHFRLCQEEARTRVNPFLPIAIFPS